MNPPRDVAFHPPYVAPLISPVAHAVLERMLEHFFPDAVLGASAAAPAEAWIDMAAIGDDNVAFNWYGTRYTLQRQRRFSVFERLLLHTIIETAGERLLGHSGARAGGHRRASLDDHCVAAFVASSIIDGATVDERQFIATLTGVIAVLRHATVSTQENRRITSGALVRADVDDGPLAAGAPRLRVDWPLRSWKTLHRLCDGVRTLAVIDSSGCLTSVLDVGGADASASRPTPYPVASGHRAHARATLDGRGVCLVLTAHGSIQLFAHGVQVFTFEQGRWRLRNTGDKLVAWQQDVGDAELANRLLTAALDLSERRIGGMFVVLDDACDHAGLVSASDQLTAATASVSPAQPLHYLFRGANVLRMPDGVVENAASIDGAVVLRRNGDLVAVGAILRSDGGLAGIEGARTTAAVAASAFGAVLKISEDGEIAFFRNRARQWSL